MRRAVYGIISICVFAGVGGWFFHHSPSTPHEKPALSEAETVLTKPGDYAPTPTDKNRAIEAVRSIIKSGKGIKEANINARIDDILVFDATIQMDINMSGDEIIESMNNAGVAMALLHDVDRGTGDKHRSVELIEKHPSRFLLGAPKMTQAWDENPDEYAPLIADRLKAAPLKAIGEIHLHHNCKLRSDRVPVTVDPDSPAVHAIAKLAALHGVPLFIHYEPMKEGTLLVALETLLRTEPNTTFIWSHGGWETAEVVGDMMSRHPNLYITIAKRIGLGQICDDELQSRVSKQREILGAEGRIKKEWRKVLRFHSQRILYASDAQVPELLGDHYVRRLDKWRHALARDLKPRQVRRILHLNAIQLFAPDILTILKNQRTEQELNQTPASINKQAKNKRKKQNRTKKTKNSDGGP